jgi:replicative DNA helicase
VFTLADEQIALLLRHLWATDGSIVPRKPGQRGGARVYFSTCSQMLASDVAALLLRLGIVARIRSVHGAGRPVYTVDVSGDAQRRFLAIVGGLGPRAAPAAALAAQLAEVASNTNVDTVPQSVFNRVRSRMRERGVTTRAMASLRGTAYGGAAHFSFAPSRQTLDNYARLLDDADLATWANSDLFWDRVTAIVPEGEEEVFDLTVPGPACWLADGIVTHNSGAIEQDADMILFIYREEYYDKNSPRKGEADVELAKHRNGETGHFVLTFQGKFTRFTNFMPEAYAEGVLR